MVQPVNRLCAYSQKPRNTQYHCAVIFLCIALGTFCTISMAGDNSYTYPLSNNDVVGENRIVATSAEDTLVDLAARYQLGYNVIRSANPTVDAWLPGDNTPVILPLSVVLPNTPRVGIVINIPEMRLYAYDSNHFNSSSSVTVYSISVGRGEWTTPITRTRVTGRAENPVWYPPKTIRDEHAARGDNLPMKVPAGPDNPLGRFLLMLDIPSYFIHGTNKQFGIGMQVTHGCIRMYPDGIEQLVNNTANDTPVTIVNQTFKTGWLGNQLYLEVHPPLEARNQLAAGSRTDYVNALVAATKNRSATIIDWDTVDRVINEARGMPVSIGTLATIESAAASRLTR